MKLTTTKKTLAFALSALALSMAAQGCSLSGTDNNSTPGAVDESTGSLGLDLTLSNGAELTSVSATISGSALAAPITRTIQVPGKASTVSALFGGLPAGNYSIAISGTATDGKTTCSGTANFAVAAGQTASVVVPVACTSDVVRGSVGVDGQLNTCAELTFLYAAPLKTDVGGSIAVEAEVHDTDGSTITYAWTSANGSFADAAAAATTYNCSAPGDQTLVLTVKDGATCSTMQTVNVRCEPTAVCGDGNVETSKGEQCDPPVAGACDANCQTIAVVCGNGMVQTGEDCDPPNGTTCNASCKSIVCGDGNVEGTEQCEPPNSPRGAGNCDASCKTIPSVCGNGIKEPGEGCDAPGDASCLPTCQPNGDLCGTCQTANCNVVKTEKATRCTGTSCDAYNQCLADTQCAKNDVRDCYCGSTPYTSCFLFDANAPVGPCKNIINTMAGSTTPLQVGTVFFDGTTPLGAVNNLEVCSATNCQSTCF